MHQDGTEDEALVWNGWIASVEALLLFHLSLTEQLGKVSGLSWRQGLWSFDVTTNQD